MFERELPDADVVISQPFWPAYLTADRIAQAKRLKLAITAGIGSDHVDLQAAIDRGITVAEVTYSNSISVSEHVVMMILELVRKLYIPSYQWVVKGGWNIADCVSAPTTSRACTSARSPRAASASRCFAGSSRSTCISITRSSPTARSGREGAQSRLAPMSRTCQGLRRRDDQRPLHPETENLINDKTLAIKRGAYLVNTARGKICDRDASSGPSKAANSRLRRRRLVPAASAEGPSLADHAAPWHDAAHFRNLDFGADPLRSGHARDSPNAGSRATDPDEYLIVDGGKLAGAGAHSYSAGDATNGSEEAAKFKNAL